ncbi:hypothetical protein FRC12_024358 [Ceratobasidium sp. 428]|nr:hypothetical protein FRC12_024358 [Ceratobasidium sp. 428]
MSIHYFEEAISLMPNKSPEKPEWLDDLGESYALLFVHESSRETLKKWIYCFQETPPAPDNYPDTASVQYMPADSHRFFLKCFEVIKDKGSVFDYKKQVTSLNSEGNPRAFFWLYNLGVWHKESFDSSDKVEVLRKSVDLLEQYDLLTPSGHPDKPTALSTLGDAYWTLFECLGELESINKSISLQEQSLELLNKAHDDRTELLNGLGIAYFSRFEYRGDIEDLEKSLHYQQQAVQMTSADHPSKALRLANLGPLYLRMFTQLGKTMDLEKSIDCLKQALKLTGDSKPKLKASCLNNLGCSYSSAYEYLGQLTNLEDAISYHEQAVSLTPDTDLAKPARLSNLGSLYRFLYYRLGRLEDLDMGIKYLNNALLLAPDDHPEKSEWLGSLANFHLELFERLGRIDDVETAKRYYEAVIDSTPNHHPSKALWYHGLGNSYEYCYEQWHQLEDIQKSLNYHQQAVLLARSGELDKSVYLSALGDAYKSLFEHLGDSESIDRAIKHYEEALKLVPDSHLFQAGRLKSLGVSYMCRFEHLRRLEDAEKARDYFKQATKISNGDSQIKLVSGKGWAWSCLELNESPLEAYAYTMELVPEVVWLGSSVGSRYERLNLDIGQLVTHAAAVACAKSKLDLALEWLEAGRRVVWGQMLHLRTPLDDLSAVDQDLAEQLMQVSLSLRQTSKPFATSDQISTQMPAIAGIDYLPNELSVTAASSTVVVINLHANRCDAVALIKESLKTIHVPLPKFSYHKAIELRGELLVALNSGHIRARSKRQPVYFADHTEEQFYDILSILWTDIVSPILNAIGYLQSPSPESELPHITWCTVGPLAFLPIHAATSQDGDAGVLGYVVSSYTPTLSTLLKPSPRAPTSCHILAVGQAASAGSAPLPGTVIELDYIQANSSQVPITRLEGNSATVDAVLSGTEECNWVHLACHASQNISDPNKSSFQLHDGELSLARITQQSLPHAEFAFLSACETATGDETLPDEAVHLAAGMLMVGYSGVIATMWSVQDEDAPLVAEKVYAHMFGGGTPDSKKAARALHEAVHSLRKTVGSKNLRRWAPYIHMGL